MQKMLLVMDWRFSDQVLVLHRKWDSLRSNEIGIENVRGGESVLGFK